MSRPNESLQRKLQGSATALFLTVTTLCSPCLYGQTQAPKAASVPVAPATAEAEDVSLDLLVHDKSGRPVLDLRPSDISVTDDGAPVKMTGLRLVKGEPPNGRKVTIVFGSLDTAGHKNARDVATKLLGTMPNGFSYAVMNVGTRLRLLQTFTTDRATLETAITMATAEERPAGPGANAVPEKNLMSAVRTGADPSGLAIPAADLASDKVLLTSLEESQRIAQDQNSQASMAGLLALARTEKDIPGRKVVIYLTQGFQMDTTAIDMVHNIIGAANASGVTIFTIDLSALDQQTSNGLMATMAMGAAGPGLGAAAAVSAAPPQGYNDGAGTSGMLVEGADFAGRIENSGLIGNGNALAALSGATGGTYMSCGDNVKKSLRKLVDDLTTYYEASFIPAAGDYDGHFRPVRVISPRKNIVMRYRAGYFALAPGATGGVRPFETPLLKILAGAELPTSLNFKAGVLRMGNLQEGNSNTLVVEAPLDNIDVREDQNTKLYSLHVSIVAQIKNKAGAVIDHFAEDVPRHGAIESLQGSHSEVITLQRHFVVPPGEYVLEAAILDHNSDKAGAQRIKFDVPEPVKGLALSDVALVRHTDMVRPDADATEPLKYGKAKVVPNLSGEVTRDSKDISVFFIIHPDPGPAPIKLQMEVLKDGKSIGKMPLPVRSDANTAAAVPYLGTIQAKSLSPGRYEVAAILSQGDKTVQGSTYFTIVGGEVASADISASGVNPAAHKDSDSDMTSDTQLPGIVAREASHLVITTPTEAVTAPKPEEIAAMLAGARARALHYSDSLPNFSCVEVTSRSIDPAGKGAWKHKDSIAELLKYRDHEEARTMLEVDGHRTKTAPDGIKGMTSHGQFGGVLNAIFDPAAKADFVWKETDMLGSGQVQVFSYKVEQKNSNYGLVGDNLDQINVAFHGLVYIDAGTFGVRRVTLEADDIPRKFSIHASSMAVDYNYVMINNHDYLMPVHAAVSIRQGKHQGVLNELEFRDYRRFGSRVRILTFTQPPPTP